MTRSGRQRQRIPKRKHHHNADSFAPRIRRCASILTTPGAMFAGSSTSLQNDQGLAPEMATAGQGQETGMSAQAHEQLVELSRRRIKVLKEFDDIDRKMSAINTSLIAEVIRRREEENRELQRKLTSRSQAERAHASSRSLKVSCNSDLVERLSAAFSGYVYAVEKFGNHLHKKWSEITGRMHWQNIETLEQLLKNFKRVPDGAHAAFKREFPIATHLIWEHWVSIVMFNGFENYPRLFRASSLEQFLAKKYVEILPHTLLLEVGGRSRDQRTGRFEGDMDFWAKFVELAKHVWLLHKLVSSASDSPPATLVRVRPGTTFLETHHSWAMHPSPQPRVPRIVDVMLTPGLCVGNDLIVKSRVLCSRP